LIRGWVEGPQTQTIALRPQVSRKEQGDAKAKLLVQERAPDRIDPRLGRVPVSRFVFEPFLPQLLQFQIDDR
jgi:hypothetical protein